MHTAFIGLDYIVDIMHPNGKIARAASQASERDVVGKANRVLAIARERDWLRVLVKVGFALSYLDQPKASPMFGKAHEVGALALGAKGTEFHPQLDVGNDCLVVIKPRVSGFYGTSLDAILRANHIQRLVIAGVSSTWAVQNTVRDGHDRDYEVIVVEDACAAASEEEHDASMQMLGTIARVVTSEALVELM